MAICVALYSLALLAAAPSLQCSAVFGPTRVLVNVQLRDFFDHELLRLVRLGLEGHLHLDINVVQHRRFWFDETISGRSTEFVFSYLKADDSFWLDQRIQVDDPLRLELERFALSFDRAPEEGTY